jgi:hypothetical protein
MTLNSLIMKNKVVYLSILMLTSMFAYGQTPKDDSTWVKLTNIISNEFEFNKNGTKTSTQQFRYILDSTGYFICQPWDKGLTQYIHFQKWKTDSLNDVIHGFTPKPRPNYYKTEDSSNVELSYGSLKLIARKHNPKYRVYYDLNQNGNKMDDSTFIDYKYTVTDISGHDDFRTTIPYFLEVRMRLPDGSHDGISVAAWNYSDVHNRKDSCNWSEVDLYEYNGTSKVYTHNVNWEGYKSVYHNEVHMAIVSPSVKDFYSAKRQNFQTNYWPSTNDARSSTDSAWHTYGVEVNSRFMAWYIDGRQVQFSYFPKELKSATDPSKFRSFIPGAIPFIPKNAADMDIELGINTLPGYDDTPGAPDSSVSFPFLYDIDYIRYYRPRVTHINDTINLTNYNLDNHSESIYKKITLGGVGGAVTLSSGKNTTLRATGDIILKDGFEIPLGATIYILNTTTP